MGVTFRSGEYIRHVFLGGRTIKDGEAAAIWDRLGTHRQIIGPRRVWLYNATIRFLTRHKAEANQYLKVSHRDGRVEHVHGPAVMYENPAFHDKVTVEDGLRLCSDSECVVTFNPQRVDFHSDTRSGASATEEQSLKTQVTSPSSSLSSPSSTFKKTNNTVTKRVIYGPTFFIPKPSEYVQSFTWSGLKTFQILQTSGNTSFKVTIPTLDGFTFEVSLVLSYTTTSIDKVITNKDPINHLHNGLRFDSQKIGDIISSASLKSKKEDVLSSLSETNTYPSLLQAATKCGLNIESIQVISIDLCPSLKAQIEKEQKLSADIQSEVAKTTHSYELRKMEMEAQQKRVEEEAELKKKEARMNDEVDLELHKLKLAALERKLELDTLEAEGMQNILKAKDDSVLEFMMKMKQMGVDMTKFMTTYGGIGLANKVVGKSELLGSHMGGVKDPWVDFSQMKM